MTMKRPFVMTIVALASTSEVACGSTSEKDCSEAKANDACNEDGDVCFHPVSCTSGQQILQMTCTDGYWKHDPTSCSRQADQCDGPYRCEQGSWQFYGYGGNPPALCPKDPPLDGDTCSPNQPFGGDAGNCGYPCNAGSGWSLVSCVASGETGTWSIGSCDPDG
jgi:hypothetical protein